MKLRSKYVLVDGAFIEKTIVVEQGSIIAITDDEVVDLHYGDQYIVPGFIDVHLHGCYGVNSMDRPSEALRVMSEKLLWEGVTSYLPTTTSLDVETIQETLHEIGDYIERQPLHGAEVLGIHLEGPFLASKYAGAQQVQYLTDASIEAYQAFQNAAKNHIRYLTMATERDEAFALLNYIRKHDPKTKVSIGHSAASLAQANAAIEHGVSSITHLFNGMAPLHHRDANLALCGLLNDEVYVEITADGFHVDFEMIKLVLKCKPLDKIVLITDANQTKGLGAGRYNLNGREVEVDQFGVARIAATGSLAGSTARLDACIRNMIQHCGVSAADAFAMASRNPAAMLQLDRKGNIAIGYDADLTILNQAFQVQAAVCRGVLREDIR